MQKMKGKKLLVLGSNYMSCEIIRQAKTSGIYVIVTDYLKDSPGKKLADKSFDISITNVDEIVNLIKREHVDGVIMGFADSILPYYLMICEATGLPCYITKEQIDVTTNKAEFKKLCRKYTVPVVTEYEIHHPLIPEDLEKIKFPVIIKPVDNSGGRGITICKDQKALFEGYQKAVYYSPSGKVILENYMHENEVTIYYIIQNGEIMLAAMADRYTTSQSGSIIQLPLAYILPSKYLETYKETLDNKVKEMFKSLEIKNGVIYIQSFVGDKQFTFYEMGFRLTGSMEYKLVGKITGVNSLDLMINFALSGQMCDTDLRNYITPNFKRLGCNMTFSVNPGKIGSIVGIEEANAVPGVLDIVKSYMPGDEILISAAGTLMQVVVRVFAVADNLNELARIIDKVNGLIKVYSNDGSEMLIKAFNFREFLYSGE